MKKLFIKKTENVLKKHLIYAPQRKNPFYLFKDVLAQKNYLKGKYLYLLPKNDLIRIVGTPCKVMKDRPIQEFNKRVTGYKKLRNFFEIKEENVCKICPQRNTCHLKDKVPKKKLNSVEDVAMVLYSMIRHDEEAQAKKNVKSGPPHPLDSLNIDEKKNLFDEILEKKDLDIDDELEEEKLSNLDEREYLEKQKNEVLLYLSGIRILDSFDWILERVGKKEAEILDEIIDQNQNSVGMKFHAEEIIEELNNQEYKKFFDRKWKNKLTKNKDKKIEKIPKPSMDKFKRKLK